MIYPQEYGIRSDITSQFDIIGDNHICKTLLTRFGPAILYGTIIASNVVEGGGLRIKCCEHQILKHITGAKRIVEIGTKFGVGSTFLAHNSDHLTTIDIIPRTEPIAIWDYFGVNKKITYAVIESDKEKREYLDGLDFDLAVIDGDHTPEGVKSDFESVMRCGRVLFHEYILNNNAKFGPTIDFLKTLPQDEITYDEPFAYWEKR